MQHWLRRGGLVGLIAVVAVIVVPPLRVETLDLETRLARDLGIQLHVGDAHWRLLSGPGLELSDSAVYWGGFSRCPLAMRVDEVLLSGTWNDASDSGPHRAELHGLEARCGPIAIADARVSLERSRDRLSVQGRARGTRGGSLEITGSLGGLDPASDPLRIYLAQLELPLLQLFGVRVRPLADPLSLTGVVALEGNFRNQQVDFDLEGTAARREGLGDWLRAVIRGRLSRRSGRFVPGDRLRIETHVRELGGDRDLHAVHGRADLWVDVLGDAESGRVGVRGDLAPLRLRLAEILEKPSGSPASIDYESRWRNGGGPSESLRIVLGDLSLRLDRDASMEPGTWRARSDPWVFSELSTYIPALRNLTDEIEGELTFTAETERHEGVLADASIRGLRFGGVRGVRVPTGQVEFRFGSARFDIPRLVVADQVLKVRGEFSWPPPFERAHLSLALEADQLDLEALAEAARHIGGGEILPGLEGRNEPWAEVAGALVKALRKQPRLLAVLEVEPATLDVGMLSGFGLDTKGARFQMALVDQRLHFEQIAPPPDEGASGYSLNLQDWLPKLTEAQ